MPIRPAARKLRIWSLIIAICVAVLGMSVPVQAKAPDRSLRPQMRPAVMAVLADFLADLSPGSAGLVAPRVGGGDSKQTPTDARSVGTDVYAALPPLVSLRPNVRPARLARRASNRANNRASNRATTSTRGIKSVTLCGNRHIKGETVGRVPGRISACGITGAVRVTSMRGIPFSQPALMNCRTAKAVDRWVDGGLKPAVGSFRGGVAEIAVAAHYSCRTRNNQPGAKVSEHGKGNAIDISGFRMKDGSRITVLHDWGRGKAGKVLRDMHRRACGPFGVTLGPEADKYHRDHFHYDTSTYSYCR